MDPLQILTRLEEGHTNPPTDAELSAAHAELKDAFDAATSAETPDVKLCADLKAALTTVTDAQAARTEASEKIRAEVQAMRADVFPEAEDKGGDEETPAEETPAEDAPAEDKVPVAASADIIARLRNHAASVAPVKEDLKVIHGATLKSVGSAAGYDLAPDAGFRELGAMFAQHGRSSSQRGVPAPLARLERSYPEARQLGNNVEQNQQRIADVMGTGNTSRQPITAAGGICGPGDVDHSHPICSQGGRVVTPALPGFNAARGTLTVPPSISIGDLAGNVSIWTSETDANPQSNTKPCPPIVCDEEITEAVDAVVQCITIGNFQAKFSPELWAAKLEVLAAAHDRLAEQKALEEIYALSNSVGTVNEGSTVWNFVQLLRNTISADRSHRRNWDGRYIVIADAYGRDQMRNQLVANLGSGVSLAESMNVADATIDSWFADLNVEIVWTYDGTYTGSTHRVIAPHSQTGHIPPADFGVHIFPVETFLFLDGGTLDLGTEISDSTLNATNDRQAFAETFEKVMKRGCDAYRGVVTIDASCGCGLTSI